LAAVGSKQSGVDGTRRRVHGAKRSAAGAEQHTLDAEGRLAVWFGSDKVLGC
jgi:hypothetical protein